ncbi:hypothetical protein M885DRAFT_547594 [Pelagophyceae sp. CCMP2097]|nr:hypothetical protein M885DRAFT_547594 [Pelagophyceae sp. CCMP2097]
MTAANPDARGRPASAMTKMERASLTTTTAAVPLASALRALSSKEQPPGLTTTILPAISGSKAETSHPLNERPRISVPVTSNSSNPRPASIAVWPNSETAQGIVVALI